MPSKSKNPVVATTAGAIAGGIETLAVWPMEMIKTNLQLGSMRAQYTGMLAGVRYHVRTDGIGSLYRGLTPVLLGSLPKAGVRFGAFDLVKAQLADENGKISATRNFAAGMIAGAIEATLAMTPIETLKTKLIGANTGVWEGTQLILAKDGIRGFYQGLLATVLKQTRMQGLQAPKYKSTFDCFHQMLLHEGVTSFYAGLVPRLGRTVPGQGITFMTYDAITQLVVRYVEA
ncbi:hypothetical protein BBJ29_008606 [Phytophthora kernoviae]|uniref:Tricarboxylate transporter n=1 Tax=Phytophthora kernoviae TaxID=325452 RepID=A0A3R7HLF6_9STRA|nr:hypothetical protein BBJ29_008606 [Phytophthora kernoviae]